MKKSFSIIELLIVVCIIWIIVAALIPRLQWSKNAKNLEIWNNVICDTAYWKIIKKTDSKLVIESKDWDATVYSAYQCEKSQ